MNRLRSFGRRETAPGAELHSGALMGASGKHPVLSRIVLPGRHVPPARLAPTVLNVPIVRITRNVPTALNALFTPSVRGGNPVLRNQDRLPLQSR